VLPGKLQDITFKYATTISFQIPGDVIHDSLPLSSDAKHLIQRHFTFILTTRFGTILLSSGVPKHFKAMKLDELCHFYVYTIH